ncbi:MAG TPA: translation initiation factor IF-2 [Candidatus Pacearchaeota archaeon]|nr:translation initiation factor IF-2 [Candidatus Pacearchaeota archaeon]HOL90563.1 translation initiation factor IF-2 [Candidatus Pacearchaeota archaeon]
MEQEQKEKFIRPPVVVVLGHVDHGKSSILEAIKDLKITSRESGGITQHIGAYEIEHQNKKITFIDTPGHEAFSAIRARGVNVADIAILVVAADEGVKPQTIEAINHIKSINLPLIVAINKIDKPEADPERVKRELMKYDIVVESLGGKIPSVNVSAKTKKGINDLLEMILLMAEMENLEADISSIAEGVIIESYLDSLTGPTATIILQKGILKKGDIIATQSAFGKVKILKDFQGKIIEKCLPSMPAIVIGFEGVPIVGEIFKTFETIEKAKENIKKEEIKNNPKKIENIEEKKVLNLILKADVFGSLEAIKKSLESIPQEKVILNIIKQEVGDINESDIKLAKTSDAIIIGFRVKINSIVKNLALREKIRIRNFDIIYELVQSVRDSLEKLIEPEITKVILGKVKILAIFKTEKNRQIIGGKVIDGKVKRGAMITVFRNEEKIGEGKIIKLQKDKKDTDEVLKGYECGMLFEGNIKIEIGDILEVYIEEKNKKEL